MNVNFVLGEVTENIYSDTYDSDPSLLGVIVVKTFDDENPGQLITAKPFNSRQKEIPIIGEHVLLFEGTSQLSTKNKTSRQWYYFPSYSVQSNINQNTLPDVATVTTGNLNNTNKNKDNRQFGESFQEKIISHLRPFEGDTIIEGRFSNSIRLGSTNIQGTYETPWTGNTQGDPIIILSNGHGNDSEPGFTTIENINMGGKGSVDESSVYLTSRQQIPGLQLYRTPTKSAPVASYQGPQLIGDADRIILRARVDSIILDSPNRITLGSREIRIGNENAGHPLVKGDSLKTILQDLVAIINAGVIGPVGITSAPIQQGKLIGLLDRIGKLNSDFHYFDK